MRVLLPGVVGAVVLTVCAGLLTAPGFSPASAEQAGGRPGVARLDAAGLDTGAFHACAITATGQVRCWGLGGYGQLGQGNGLNVGDQPGESTVGVDLGPGRTAVAIAAGYHHTCAVLDTGAVACWGRNTEGQLGQGNTVAIGDDPGEAPVRVDLGAGRTAVAITAGSYHSCAILDTGHLRCWGHNAAGQLGQGHTAAIGDNPGETTVPVDLGPGRSAVAVSAGSAHTCAVLDTGALRCWGDNSAGQLGQGNTDNVGDSADESTVRVDFGIGRKVVAVAAGTNHTCAVLDTGSVRCWGNNLYGQLGQGSTAGVGDDPGENTVGVDLGAGRTAEAITAGSYHSCAILDTGNLHCWGHNAYGQLGQGHPRSVGDDPGETTVGVDLGAGRTALAVAADFALTCAVSDLGTVRCWGLNLYGQLGQGNATTFGDDSAELPAILPPIELGGATAGRDSDGDGVRDAVDLCPTVPAPAYSGCPPTPAPTPTPGPAPTPAPTPTPATRIATRLSLAVDRARDHAAPYVFAASGRLRARRHFRCAGRVTLRLTKSTRRIELVKRAKLRRSQSGCRYATTLRLTRAPARKLGLTAFYRGTDTLAADTSRRVTLRLR